MNTTKAKIRPITLNMKVGDILNEHPELLDVLVAQSPHFARLKNPILRRIHGKLVTLGQAAAIAGVDPAALVRTLNAAIGLPTSEETPTTPTTLAGTPEPLWVTSAPVAARLDVRDDQRKHADPFSKIMAAVARVQEGQVFYLRNTFEPLPLYDVLSKRGFVAWARKLAADDWEIFFLKVNAGSDLGAARSEDEKTTPVDTIDVAAPTATITIDVRDLTPPQPMMKILDALEKLQPGETLLVHHRRRPVHLYPKLAELGYAHKTVERGPEQVDIYIRKN